MKRLLLSLLPTKCCLCREWHRHMAAHLNWDHFGEQP